MALEIDNIEHGPDSATRYFRDDEVALTGTIRAAGVGQVCLTAYVRVSSETVHVPSRYFDDVEPAELVGEEAVDWVVYDAVVIAHRRGLLPLGQATEADPNL